LSKYATADDLRNTTNQKHCALGHNGDGSWKDIWKAIIKMPVDASSDDEPGRYLEILKVLFERPPRSDQRRPTELMWEAQEWLGRRAGLNNLIPRLHVHLVSQFQSIKQQPEYQSAINELLDPARYVLLRCGDKPVLDKDTGVFTRYLIKEFTLKQRFGICKYQMTREQFSIWDNLPSKQESNLPATDISWLDCYFMLVGLSGERVKLSDGREYQFTFPTEKQWEYACRAGSTTLYCFGDNKKKLSEYAWYDKNSDRREHPVGRKKANGWGLHDMHGNVREWCWDRRKYYANWSATDPLGPDEGSYRMYGGGCWYDTAERCGSAIRNGDSPEYRNSFLGFRVALSSTGIPKSPEAGKSSGDGGS
jgi:formylglycine-generating enzyme required for sulfatase activity